jgi:hypothetical protein
MFVSLVVGGMRRDDGGSKWNWKGNEWSGCVVGMILLAVFDILYVKRQERHVSSCFLKPRFLIAN